MTTVTKKLSVWLTDMADIPRLNDPTADVYFCISQGSTDMTSEGWLKVREMEVNFERPRTEDLLEQALGVLKVAEDKVNADAAEKLLRLAKARNALLTIGYGSATEPA